MKSNDPQVEARKHRLQMDIMIKDSDFKKNERKKIDLDVAVRDLKRKRNQIDVELQQKETELKKLTMTQVQLFNETKKLKGMLNQM